MPSLFSMFHRRSEPTPHENNRRSPPIPAEREPALTSASLATNSAPSPADILRDMLARLDDYLPPKGPSLPEHTVSSVSVRQRPVGIGNWRGSERRGALAEISLKGGRLDTVVRFQLWADTISNVDGIVETLHSDLLTDSDQLRVDGFLRVNLIETNPAEFIDGSVNAWRKTTDYKILYEYHYQDIEGAESIVARIPIHSDLEEGDSAERETTLVTDELSRWDDIQASPIEVSATVNGRVRVYGFASLAYRPLSWLGNSVTVARMQRNVSDPPTTYPTLSEFHAAVTRKVNPDRHAQIVFPSLSDFLAAFAAAGDPFALGDWDNNGTPDIYEPGVLEFNPPLVLDSSNDLLRVSYQDAAFDSKAVVYLRAGVR